MPQGQGHPRPDLRHHQEGRARSGEAIDDYFTCCEKDFLFLVLPCFKYFLLNYSFFRPSPPLPPLSLRYPWAVCPYDTSYWPYPLPRFKRTSPPIPPSTCCFYRAFGFWCWCCVRSLLDWDSYVTRVRTSNSFPFFLFTFSILYVSIRIENILFLSCFFRFFYPGVHG